jgi:hypothetical protein
MALCSCQELALPLTLILKLELQILKLPHYLLLVLGQPDDSILLLVL